MMTKKARICQRFWSRILRSSRLAGLVVLVLAVHPRGAQAQLDQLFRSFIPAPQAPSYPSYSPPAYQQGYPQPYQTAPPYTRPPPMPRPPAEAADANRQTVAQVQTMLNDLGYDAGAADGSSGGRTIRAVEAFQRDHGEAPTGRITEATVAALRATWYAQAHATGAPSTAAANGEATGTQPGPSFDCRHAASPSERAICAMPDLSRLDGELSATYAAARSAQGSDNAALMESQRTWLQQRNACGVNARCLRESMSARLAELRRWPGAAGGAPSAAESVAATQSGAAMPDGGKFCVFGRGNSYNMLLLAPQPDGTLAFGISSWTASGSNFSAGGIAGQAASGWAYRDQMNSPDPDQRCAININRGSSGAWQVSTVAGARCEALAGHGAVLTGTDVFPPESRVGAAPGAFLDNDNMTRIGCDRAADVRQPQPVANVAPRTTPGTRAVAADQGAAGGAATVAAAPADATATEPAPAAAVATTAAPAAAPPAAATAAPGGVEPGTQTATPTIATPSPAHALVGEWQGRYGCDSVSDDGFDLTVTRESGGAPGGALSGVFRFDVPAKPGQAQQEKPGRFRMRGNAAGADGSFTLAPTEWIDHPDGFVPMGLSGRIDANGLSMSGTLPGCGRSSFIAQRKNATAVLRQAEQQDGMTPPGPGGPFEGVWRGEISCSTGRTNETFPISLTVSEQGDTFGALLDETVTDRRGGARQVKGVFLSRSGSGAMLDEAMVFDRLVQPMFPLAISFDEAGKTIRFKLLVRGCNTSLAKVSSAIPGDFGAQAAGLVGTWVTPSPVTVQNEIRNDPRMVNSLVASMTTSVLQFQREGNVLYGQIRSFYPAGQPADQQSRLVADLRPIVTMDDGRIGFIETLRRRAEGAFDTSTKGGYKATLSYGLFLLMRPPTTQDTRLEVAVSANRMFNPEPDMILDRRDEAQAQAIALGGGPPIKLPAGLGGRIARAQSLGEQCQVLAAWGQPLTGRSDAMTAPVDQLQRETLPLFEDSAFVPVFGLSYIMTTPDQRRPIYYLLARDCPQRMKIQTGHVNLTYPWLPAQGSTFGAIAAGLMARHEALAKVATASERLPALPETQAGQNELRQIAGNARPFYEKLDEKERNDFVAVLRTNDLRIANGMMRARIAAIPDLPANDQGLDTLRTLVADIGKSGLPEEEKERAQQAADARVQDIVRTRIAAIDLTAPQMPATLAGLAQATRAIREVSALATRPGVGMGVAAGLQQAEPVLNRRREIMADPGVLQQFRAAMLIAAQRGTQESVGNTAAAYLLPEELRDGGDGVPFREAIVAAQQQVESERVAAVLGEDSDSAPQAGRATQPTATGEPSSRDMLAAVEDVANGLNAGQNDLASRCTRGGVRNDPGLAIMCLVQMGGGGPMQTHITRFRKTACSQAQGKPGWVCDYSFAMDVSNGRDMGYLGQMMGSGGNCTGRFVRSGSRWMLEERSCS